MTTNQEAIRALFRVVNRYVGNLAPMPGVLAEPGISPPQLELPGMFTEKSGVSDCSVAASQIRELTSPLRFRRNDFAAIFLVERSRPETITRHIRVCDCAGAGFASRCVFLPRLGPPNPGGPFYERSCSSPVGDKPSPVALPRRASQLPMVRIKKTCRDSQVATRRKVREGPISVRCSTDDGARGVIKASQACGRVS